ncbi:MAG: putative nucleic-acid-binding protein containing a Zn-ribbon [Rhodobacteraceae bacterium HLUCCA12]|nr:MAG: putative nucleic-acid-binding protein containing a Zn-ribbon [Rhodobacteraceae bacterium HLUCCA12]
MDGMTEQKTNPHVFVLKDELPNGPGLRAARCRACGRHTQGRVLVCAHCFSDDLEALAAGHSAELIEHSIARVPAGGFDAPYAIGQIRTDEGMILFAPLLGDPQAFGPGKRLRFVQVDHPTGISGFAYELEEDGAPE